MKLTLTMDKFPRCLPAAHQKETCTSLQIIFYTPLYQFYSLEIAFSTSGFFAAYGIFYKGSQVILMMMMTMDHS